MVFDMNGIKLFSIFILLSIIVSCQSEERGVDTVVLRHLSLYASDVEPTSRTSFGYDNTQEKYVTAWSANDAMRVLVEQNAVVNEYVFDVKDVASGRFESDEVVDDGSAVCDAYGVYPSSVAVTKADKTAVVAVGSAVQTQHGESSNHIAEFDPLYGSCKEVNIDNINLYMRHTASVVRFNVQNESGVSQVIRSVKITAPRPLTGSYTLDLQTGKTVLVDNGSCDVVLNVEGGEVAHGNSFELWVAAVPFEMYEGEKLIFTVTTQDDGATYRYEKQFTSDVEFPAAKIMRMDDAVVISDASRMELQKSIEVDLTSSASYTSKFPTGKNVISGVVDYELGGYPFKIECTKPYSCGNRKNLLRFYFNGGNASSPITPTEADYALIYLPVFDGYRLSMVDIKLEDSVKLNNDFKITIANPNNLSSSVALSNNPQNTTFSDGKLAATELDKQCCIYIHFIGVNVNANYCNCNIEKISLTYEIN